MKISLQEAFGKRNDIKREIEGLKSATIEYLWHNADMPVNFELGTAINPDVAIKKSIELMDELASLNKKIYDANVANNGLLRDLETIGAKISLYERVASSLKRFPGEKERNRYYNVDDANSKEFIENALNVSPKEVNERLDFFKKEKRRVEDALRHNNYTLTIEL